MKDNILPIVLDFKISNIASLKVNPNLKYEIAIVSKTLYEGFLEINPYKIKRKGISAFIKLIQEIDNLIAYYKDSKLNAIYKTTNAIYCTSFIEYFPKYYYIVEKYLEESGYLKLLCNYSNGIGGHPKIFEVKTDYTDYVIILNKVDYFKVHEVICKKDFVPLDNDKRLYTLRYAKFDLQEAANLLIRDFKDNNYSALAQRFNLILATLNQNRYISQGNSGRISHTFTNTPSIARPALKLNGKSFISRDISSAGITLMYEMLKENGYILSEVTKTIIETGNFYKTFKTESDIFEDLIKPSPLNNETDEEYDDRYLDAIKKNFFKSVLYGWITSNSIHKIFKKEFTDLHKGLNEFRKEFNKPYKTELKKALLNYINSTTFENEDQMEIYCNIFKIDFKEEYKGATLASLVFKVESNIMNKIVPEKSNGYLTWYDAIYYTDSKDTEQVTEDIKKTFKHITPNLK